MDALALVLCGPWLFRAAVAFFMLPVVTFLDILVWFIENRTVRICVLCILIWLSGIWVAAKLLSNNKVLSLDEDGLFNLQTFSASYRLLRAGFGSETVRRVQRISSVIGGSLRLSSDVLGFFASCFESIAAWN